MELLNRVCCPIISIKEPSINLLLALVGEDISHTRRGIQGLITDSHFRKLNKWLSPPDPSTNYNKALRQRYEGTSKWFLKTTVYSTWKTEGNSFLWLHGIPGCGKTILSSAIIEDLQNSKPNSQGLLYFYFDFTDTSKQSLEKAVRSLISQLYDKSENTRRHLDSLHSSHETGNQQPSIELLCRTFQTMIQHAGEVWIVLDALDECQTRKCPETEGLLSWMKSFKGTQWMHVHFLVTSRPEHDIQLALKGLAGNSIIPLQSDSITGDIRTYIRARVRQHEGLSRWQSRPEVQDEIESSLMEKAGGM